MHVFSTSLFGFSLISVKRVRHGLNCADTHVTVEDDGPYEAQDDGGASVDDVWDVDVHQFNLGLG